MPDNQTPNMPAAPPRVCRSLGADGESLGDQPDDGADSCVADDFTGAFDGGAGDGGVADFARKRVDESAGFDQLGNCAADESARGSA